ncbi:hypothetical protein [Burkholderia ubonensis]|uniref:hypothetical protein n=1 Tax=Burkholderia ubonensis TaxID=101571 RepID=UPI000AE495E1|nr:hypothetical protein [Burkholderia ubonensis]
MLEYVENLDRLNTRLSEFSWLRLSIGAAESHSSSYFDSRLSAEDIFMAMALE